MLGKLSKNTNDANVIFHRKLNEMNITKASQKKNCFSIIKISKRMRARGPFFILDSKFLRKCTLSTRDRRLKPKQEQIRCKLWLEKSITSSSWKKVNPIFFIPHLFFFTYYSKTDARAIEKQVSFFFWPYLPAICLY